MRRVSSCPSPGGTAPAGQFPLFTQLRPLVLASASPRRRDFLWDLGLNFQVRPPAADAEPVAGEKGEQPYRFVRRAAAAKAENVFNSLGEADAEAAVLGADTIVVCDGRILGKPRDAAQALDFLRCLAGREHEVITACCLYLPGGRHEVFSAGAVVAMHAWPEAMLAAYAACGEPLDKAGAYAVQGRGSFLVERVTGSWSAVVGLPMTELVAVLCTYGCLQARAV